MEIDDEIELLPSQENHFKTLNLILNKLPFVLDFSMLGSGKTFTASKLALDRKYKHVIVICPVSIIPKWRQMKAQYNVPIYSILGYQSLRGVKFKQPNHGLLYRRDYKDSMVVQRPFFPNIFDEIDIDKVEYTTTELFQTLKKEGLLLIFDEIQNVKNITSQFQAAQTLIHSITLEHLQNQTENSNQNKNQNEKESSVLCLSGSPIDKIEQAIHLFRLLGIMSEDRIAQYNIQTGLQDWRGMQEIYDFCFSLNEYETTMVPPKTLYEKFDPYVYRLFQRVFKKYCSSSMMPPLNTQATLSKFNSYYTIDKEGEDIIKRGLGSLKTTLGFDGTTINLVPNLGIRAMAGVTRALQIIETGKIKLFVRLAQKELQNENCKVVIAVNFTETVKDLMELLKEYHPLKLTGCTTEKNRGLFLKEFQSNSLEKRLLICNQSVASTGIDLDDKFGEYPRICFVSPNYSTITSYQLGHRFLRADTKSNATVNFVFAKRQGETKKQSSDIIEIRVLDALSRKSIVMKETVSEQSQAGIVFPGDHTEWFED